ncbi:uncharacterized protein ACLA_030230 [Aspergillus clavatus NRRL 1]|uniref:Uncharacterized protein n=1 Tax=Aspergillus clavatus (strain ATCC 1007 / CBS 513.65 / DSM 816 / NCTC 3887 / NRRL 1 / QM 1276 / 107) TaxID=344612 RepID=A1CRL9_ASPCL|nr:uncharacterized protein ACLA_030230 [Aspergillus clavatus NRRL 1]EAW08290.1 hypothetical protein ACLA_030230 [Aspergillus clavatus NRRL 1]
MIPLFCVTFYCYPYGPGALTPSGFDLTYIKTRNTGTGKVDVNLASRRSNYETSTLEVGTTFSPEDNGVRQLIDADRDDHEDLMYIKTRNTGTGGVEVHVASAASVDPVFLFFCSSVLLPHSADFNR